MEDAIFNRIGNKVLNWKAIESISILTKDFATIGFSSGASIELELENEVAALKDLIEVFPDMLNDEIRRKMKRSLINPNIKTDINIERINKNRMNPEDIIAIPGFKGDNAAQKIWSETIGKPKTDIPQK